MKQLVQGHASSTQIASKLLDNFTTALLFTSWATGQRWQILFCNRESRELRKPHISPHLFQLAACPWYAWDFLWLSFNISAFLWTMKIMRACDPEVKSISTDTADPPCRLQLRNYMHFEGHKANSKMTKVNSFFSPELPIFQAPSSKTGSLHPPSFPFSYSELHRNIAEQKHFNLAKSLASPSWHCSFSFSPTLGKMRIKCTHSRMHKAAKNKAERNCDIWAYNILSTSTKGSMLMENLLWMISTAQIKEDSSCPASLAAERSEADHKKGAWFQGIIPQHLP